jgi:hypothetical protein
MPAPELASVLASVDLDAFYRNHPRYEIPGEEVILSHVLESGGKEPVVEEAVWFHITRCFAETDFAEGLLPLGDVLELLWRNLYSLVAEEVPAEEWRQCRDGLQTDGNHSARLYRMKVAGRHLWGPYGMLIRDLAFDPQPVRNHDFLRGPEIIEDICRCFLALHGIDLLSRFRSATRPCIVKFVGEAPTIDCVGSALLYLHLKYRGLPLSQRCNCNFDAAGTPVSRSQILEVQLL